MQNDFNQKNSKGSRCHFEDGEIMNVIEVVIFSLLLTINVVCVLSLSKFDGF